MRELSLVDLAKELADSGSKLKQYSSLYDIAKGERNSYASAIQSATQSIAEMRERIKILSNEVDILQNESGAKDKALTKEETAHSSAASQRDLLRVEANRAAAEYRDKQTLVEHQILQIDKLSSVINGLEKDMMVLKKDYEAGVEMRNYTGIQLIDRNDELCILYEKSNIHEKTLGDAQIALRGVMDEMRALRIVLADLQRQLNSARNKLPDTAVWAERILQLQSALYSSRQITEKLSAQLESPANGDRWVALEGEDPEVDQLQARSAQLEERLDAAREELLGRDLSLEEVSGLIERLRAELNAPAENGESAALMLAQQLNETQSRVKELNRRMMALVSELSMYQANAIRLSAETVTAQETLLKAEQDTARGLPPTVAAQQRLSLMERSRAPPAKAAEGPLADAPRSTALQRANSYIPEGLAIPKPYEFPPFQPSAPGASMRHFRNPAQRELDM
jgi:chromosome segregation ATPase